MPQTVMSILTGHATTRRSIHGFGGGHAGACHSCSDSTARKPMPTLAFDVPPALTIRCWHRGKLNSKSRSILQTEA